MHWQVGGRLYVPPPPLERLQPQLSQRPCHPQGGIWPARRLLPACSSAARGPLGWFFRRLLPAVCAAALLWGALLGHLLGPEDRHGWHANLQGLSDLEQGAEHLRWVTLDTWSLVSPETLAQGHGLEAEPGLQPHSPHSKDCDWVLDPITAAG